jgi:hypothetical protein
MSLSGWPFDFCAALHSIWTREAKKAKVLEQFIQKHASPPRCMSFSEFENADELENSSLRKQFTPFAKIRLDFHPKTRPATWRILLVQA